MNCQRCKSDRVLSVNSHASDMHSLTIKNNEHNGYIPSDFRSIIGCGDDCKFKVCLDCGQHQGTFPIGITKLESRYNFYIDNVSFGYYCYAETHGTVRYLDSDGQVCTMPEYFQSEKIAQKIIETYLEYNK